MNTFDFYEWSVAIIAVIELFVVIIALTEGKEKKSEHTVFDMKYESKWKQRICRCLIAVVCPVIYVLGSAFLLHEEGVDALLKIAVIAFCLFSTLWMLDAILFDIVYKIGCPLINILKSQLLKFKNWVWN